MDSSASAALDKVALRQEIKALRQGLSATRRSQLDAKLCRQVVHCSETCSGRNMAAFHAVNGEPDLRPALRALELADYQVHLPVLVDPMLHFRRWTSASVLTPNRYGILEPLDGRLCAANQLDWVLMPLLAFSPDGARLGMGGGYYDRSFAFRLGQQHASRPALIGVAYHWQERSNLPLQSWDVPLDGVLTERGLRWFAPAPG